MELLKVADSISQEIYLISGHDGKLPDSNIYVLAEKRSLNKTQADKSKMEICLVDVGSFSDVQEKYAALRRQFPNHSVSKIVITHLHFDHVAGIFRWLDKIKNQGRDEKGPIVILPKKNTGRLHLFGNTSIYEFAIHTGEFSDETALLENIDQQLASRAQLDYVYANASDLTSLAGTQWQIIKTPGHTSDSICLYNADIAGGTLISGDTLFSDGIGRTDLESGDSEEMKKSLARLAELKFNLLLPGHGMPETRKI